MRTNLLNCALALACLWLPGCGARAYEGGDSNSNWLEACDSSAECGSNLACVCGYCTVTCKSDDICEKGRAAVCEQTDRCGAAAVCLPAFGSEPTDAAETASEVDGGPRESSQPAISSTATLDSNTSDVTTSTNDPTSAPGDNTGAQSISDEACSDNACRFEQHCVERGGRNCVCPDAELTPCEGLTFRTLPLPEGLESCGATAVSEDGSVVVGDCQIIDGPNRAVRWDAAGAEVVTSSLDTLTLGRGVTDDGTTAFWLGSNGGTYSVFGDESSVLTSEFLNALSQDGSVGAGTTFDGFGGSSAFRWTADDGVVVLPREGGDGQAVAVSADGAVVVGSVSVDSIETATWWDITGDAHTLSTPPAFTSSTATAVNEDGTVIVGSTDQAAFLWNGDGVRTLLELESSSSVRAAAVTRDGKRVFGTSVYGGWTWDETNGLRSLEDVLGMSDTWTITWIGAVSADGKTLVGSVQRSGDVSPWRWFAFAALLP